MSNPFLRISFILLSFLPLLLPAQDRGNWQGQAASQVKLVGKVLDQDSGMPLEYASITLFSAGDSSMVTGGITNPDGSFEIETKPGKYFAKVEFISYTAFTINDIVLKADQAVTDLGQIRLAPDAETLAEVTVRAEKSEFQMMLDKKVFNVGKDLANKGGTAADILDNVPSVSVDIDGGVTLRGSGNVRILIDGKPSGLVGVGDSDGLRQIPSNLIEKVEVITNPSARYEAEGMTGIINIVLRKERNQGLNGSFDFTAGYPTNYGTAINLNYRKEKLNLFANYGIGYRRNPGGGFQYQEVYRGDTTFILQQTNDRDRGGLSNSLRLGTDIFFNPKNTLTGSFSYRKSNEDNNTELQYLDYLDNLEPQNFRLKTLRTDDQKENEDDMTFALNYKKTFDKKDQLFKADVQYENSIEDQNSVFFEKYYDANDAPNGTTALQQRSANKETNGQWIFSMDYVHPIGKEGKLEAGYRGSLREITNDYLVEEFNDVDWIPLAGLTNVFLYQENIQALYVQYGNKRNKFSYQVGLRGEYSDVNTELKQTGDKNPRQYINPFPTAFVSYDLPGKNVIQLNYSRRISRPRFWYLNPFFTYSDARNFWSGNPNIDPEFTDALEFNHIKYWEKGSLSSGIYYNHTNGVIERIRTVNEEGISFTRPENLSTRDAFGFEFTFSYSPFDWWKTNGDVNFYRAITDGGNLGQGLESDTYTWFTRLTSKITLWKKLDTQLRFNYRAPEQTTQGRNKSMYSLDLGMSTDVLKNNGTLTLSVRDLFNTRKRRYISEGLNFYSEGEFQWRSRQITLGLNYRLNQKKQRGGGERGDYQGDDMGF